MSKTIRVQPIPWLPGLYTYPIVVKEPTEKRIATCHICGHPVSARSARALVAAMDDHDDDSCPMPLPRLQSSDPVPQDTSRPQPH